MRALLVLALFSAGSRMLTAQGASITRADSALIGRVLLAEDRRDSADPALAQGVRHDSPVVRLLAIRAIGRIRDTAFRARDSLPALPAPTHWPEPAWRLRFRALGAARDDCPALRAALSDSAWPVRLHAADLARASCADDTALVGRVVQWLDSMPGDVSHRIRGGVSWQAAAHALVALTRLQPERAGRWVQRLVAHPNAHLRLYAARAAAVLGDTTTLTALATDADPNVREAALEALARLSGHRADAIFLKALSTDAPQVVRAAALALVGSPDSSVPRRASATFEQWVHRANASARDVRLALLKAAGRPASDDRPPAADASLPPEAVALALGADIRVRVTLSPASGGGSFVVRLRGDAAPITAARILDLVDQRYYDGMTWHRVEPDFVIQGGGPLNNEYSGYARYFRDELGGVPHVRGTVGMSTRAHDTGDAQWFVNLRDNLRLNPDYTVFGEVVEGMDVVDGILEGDVILSIRRLDG